jgi:phosphatidylinositol dimannoside acyltransferase
METSARAPSAVTRSSPFEDGAGPALVYYLFRAGAWLAEHVSLRFANAVAAAAGKVAFRLSRRKREIVRRNLARVVGEGEHLDAVVRDAFLSYTRYWLETFRLGRYTKQDLLTMVHCDSLDVVDKAAAQGKGVVIATAHLGFYDVGIAWICALGYKFSVVAEVLRPRALFEWFVDIRTDRGVDIIPAKPREPARRMQFESLSRNFNLALLADRDLGRRGVWVRFFGEETTLPAGPARMVVQTGAPLVAGAIYKEGERYQLHFFDIPYALTGDERHDIAAITQSIAQALEKLVSAAPEQWHLFSTNWPSDEPHLPPRGAEQAAGENSQ